MTVLLSALKTMIALITALTGLINSGGEKEIVRLYANPTTGYYWQCESDAPEVLRCTSRRYETEDRGVLTFGDTVVQAFTLTAGEPGRAVITFRYSKLTLNGRDVISTYRYVYQVDSGGHIKLLSKT